MSVCKTEAITLGRSDYQNTSQIVTFYTRHYGKIHVIARGIKRISKKQITHAVDLLAYYQILFIKRDCSSLHILTDVTLQDGYPAFHCSLDKYYRASYIAELVKEFTVEGDPCGQLFDIFLHTLTGISTYKNDTIWLLNFEIKLLKILGYLPEWRYCVRCKKGIHQLSEVYFSAKEGGVLCKSCKVNVQNCIAIHASAVLIAGQMAKLDIQKLERIKIQLSICIEIETMLRYYIRSIINKNLNTWKYIKFK